LVREAIARFPVAGFGQRNNQMVRLIGSLLGRRIRPDVIVAAVERWWRHFHDLGRIGTHPSMAPWEAGRAIESMRRSPEFAWSGMTREDHLEACRAVRLDARQAAMLGARVDSLPSENRSENVDGSARGGPDPGAGHRNCDTTNRSRL